MTHRINDSDQAAELRNRAEELADSLTAVGPNAAAVEDAAETLHELGVHQIELEMQNDELRRTRHELELLHAKYFDLYELAPVGYLSLDEDGLVIEANLTAATMLGVARSALQQARLGSFVMPEDEDVFYRFRRTIAAHTADPCSCEVRLRLKNGGSLWAKLDASTKHQAEGPVLTRVTISDISQRVAAQHEVIKDAADLSHALSSIIDVVGQVVETRDPYTAGHQRRVTELATAIATDLGMADSAVNQVKIAALLHDVGKVGIPAEILSKPGALTATEYELIKTHSETGYRIIETAHLDYPIAEVVYQHHERCDGSGYPRGLVASQLLLESKVLMVADVVEAMVSHRPYRPGLGTAAALEEIAGGSGRLYDPKVAASCARVFAEGRFVFVDTRL